MEETERQSGSTVYPFRVIYNPETEDFDLVVDGPPAAVISLKAMDLTGLSFPAAVTDISRPRQHPLVTLTSRCLAVNVARVPPSIDLGVLRRLIGQCAAANLKVLGEPEVQLVAARQNLRAEAPGSLDPITAGRWSFFQDGSKLAFQMYGVLREQFGKPVLRSWFVSNWTLSRAGHTLDGAARTIASVLQHHPEWNERLQLKRGKNGWYKLETGAPAVFRAATADERRIFTDFVEQTVPPAEPLRAKLEAAIAGYRPPIFVLVLAEAYRRLGEFVTVAEFLQLSDRLGVSRKSAAVVEAFETITRRYDSPLPDDLEMVVEHRQAMLRRRGKT